jgi:hypothetical protein
LASARRAACREVVHVAAITHCTVSQDMLWAITCYFNPIGYRRRLSNVRERLLDRTREPLVDPAREP